MTMQHPGGGHDLCSFLHLPPKHYTDEYMREKIYRGKVTQEKIPKYKLITSHSARRTFVVNNALRGKSDLEIRRATGHKSYEALRKYLKYFN